MRAPRCRAGSAAVVSAGRIGFSSRPALHATLLHSRRCRSRSTLDGRALVQDHRPGRSHGHRAPRPLSPRCPLGIQYPDPVHRAAALDRRALSRVGRQRPEASDGEHDESHRPARAGAQLPEPARHHERQRHHRYRRGDLLPRGRPAEGDVRRAEPAVRARDAHAYDAPQHRRRDGARPVPRQPRPDQQADARDDRRSIARLGRGRHARRAAEHRAAARHPAIDGAADARRARAPRGRHQRRSGKARRDPRVGRPARVADPEGPGREGSFDPSGAGARGSAARDGQRRG